MRFGDQFMRPNMWTIILAPSSSCRKSTSVAIAQRLFREAFPHAVYPGEFTGEAFLEILQNTPSGCLFSSEFLTLVGSLKKEYNAGLMAFLADIYDCPAHYERTTRAATYSIESPALNILSATTVEWFTEKINPEDFAGGFVPRFLLVPISPDTSKRYLAIPKPADDDLRNKLVAELLLFRDCHGAFTLSKESLAYYEDWYQKHVDKQGLPPMFHGSLHRMAVQALKLAMIHQAITDKGSVRGGAEIALDAIQTSCRDIDDMFISLKQLVTQEVAFTSFDKERQTILKIIESNGGSVSHSQLLRTSRMKARDMNAITDTLIEAGLMETYREETERGSTRKMYRAKDEEE